MFDDVSKARAAAILANYGATHFQVSPDGLLLAVVGANLFEVKEGNALTIGPSAAEQAADVIEAAKG